MPRYWTSRLTSQMPRIGHLAMILGLFSSGILHAQTMHFPLTPEAGEGSPGDAGRGARRTADPTTQARIVAQEFANSAHHLRAGRSRATATVEIPLFLGETSHAEYRIRVVLPNAPLPEKLNPTSQVLAFRNPSSKDMAGKECRLIATLEPEGSARQHKILVVRAIGELLPTPGLDAPFDFHYRGSHEFVRTLIRFLPTNARTIKDAKKGEPRKKGPDLPAIRRRYLAQALAFTRGNRARKEKDLNRIHLVFDEFGKRQDRRASSPPPRSSAPSMVPTGTLQLVSTLHGHRGRFERVVDSNDVIVVHVIAYGKAHYAYQVTTINKAAPEPVASIYGSFDKEARTGLRREGAVKPKNKPAESFVHYIYELGPFPEGEVKIQVEAPLDPYVDEFDPLALRKEVVHFEVYALYHFQAKLGLLHSPLADRSFREVNGRIRQINHGTPLELAFMVVPYLHSWDGRVLVEKPESFWERFNPVFGIGIEDAGANYFGGLAIQLGRNTDLIGGLNFRRAPLLNPGFSVGDAISGAPPVDRGWQSEPFIGVTFPATLFTRVFRGNQ